MIDDPEASAASKARQHSGLKSRNAAHLIHPPYGAERDRTVVSQKEEGPKGTGQRLPEERRRRKGGRAADQEVIPNGRGGFPKAG